MPSLALIVSEVSAVIRIDNMARPTRLVMLMKYIYFMGSGPLPFVVKYFPTNLFYSTSNGYDKEEVVGKSSPPELYVMNDVYNNKINTLLKRNRITYKKNKEERYSTSTIRYPLHSLKLSNGYLIVEAIDQNVFSCFVYYFKVCFLIFLYFHSLFYTRYS